MVYVDVPVSGGTVGAENGTLTFMVGAEKVEYDKIADILLGMGKNIFHCGGPGFGSSIKIVNNMILGINMIAASEGLSLAKKLGADMNIV